MTAVETLYRTNKPREYGSDADIVSRSMAELGPKELAHRIKVSRSRLHQLSDPDHPHPLTARHFLALVKAGARTPVEEVCAAAGGAFMPGAPSNETVPAMAAKSAREHAEFIAELLRAVEDGRITARERLVLIKAIDDEVRTLCAVRAHLVAEGAGDV